VLRRLRLLRARARAGGGESGGGVRAAAGEAEEGAALHRALLGACGESGAGAEPCEGAGEDRADRAAAQAKGAEVRLSQSAAERRRRSDAGARLEALRIEGDLRRLLVPC